ncbi:MAG: hypothetical protein ACI4PP_08020, partial [Clostridia bacterium]
IPIWETSRILALSISLNFFLSIALPFHKTEITAARSHKAPGRIGNRTYIIVQYGVEWSTKRI